MLAALRRHLQPVRAHAAAVRHRGPLGRCRRPGRGRPARRRQDPPRVRRDDRQSEAERRSTSRRGPRRRTPPACRWSLDNTVPTPIGARIFDQGADIAVHSLTKFIGGHGTSIGGVDRRRGQLRLGGARRALPRPDAARPVLPRRRLERRARAGRVHRARRARCCCATPARRCHRSTRSCSCRAWRRCRCGWSATRERARGRRAPRTARRSRVGLLPRACRRAPTARSPTGSCAAATARLSRSACAAARPPARRSSRA